MVKPRTRKQLRRRLPSRTHNKIELIVCEGSKTEPAYFEALKRRFRLYAVQIDVISPSESEPNAVVERAITKRKEMEEDGIPCEKLWCVVDVEIPPHSTLDEAWETASKTDKLELILTNPCIEYWFLLHFKKHTDPFGNNNDVMGALKAVHPSYKKRRIGFDDLYPRTSAAIKHSKEVLKVKKYGQDLATGAKCGRACLNPKTGVSMPPNPGTRNNTGFGACAGMIS